MEVTCSRLSASALACNLRRLPSCRAPLSLRETGFLYRRLVVLRPLVLKRRNCARRVQLCMASVITLGLGLVHEVNENINNNRAVSNVSCGRRSTTHLRERRLIASSTHQLRVADTL